MIIWKKCVSNGQQKEKTDANIFVHSLTFENFFKHKKEVLGDQSVETWSRSQRENRWWPFEDVPFKSSDYWIVGNTAKILVFPVQITKV